MKQYKINLQVSFEDCKGIFETDLYAKDENEACEISRERFLAIYNTDTVARLCPGEDYEHEYVVTISVKFDDQINNYQTCVVATSFDEACNMARERFLATFELSCQFIK